MMSWSERQTLKPMPPCWTCLRYETREGELCTLHRCHIAEPGFPNIGNHCAGYIYEPGTDPEAADE
jgi:hypothetical protein